MTAQTPTSADNGWIIHRLKMLTPFAFDQHVIDEAIAALAASQEAPKAGDWVLVPRELTDEMLWAGRDKWDEAQVAMRRKHKPERRSPMTEAWAAMLAAAPTPPASQGDAAPAGDAVVHMPPSNADAVRDVYRRLERWLGTYADTVEQKAYYDLCAIQRDLMSAAAPAPAVREAVDTAWMRQAVERLKGAGHYNDAYALEGFASCIEKGELSDYATTQARGERDFAMAAAKTNDDRARRFEAALTECVNARNHDRKLLYASLTFSDDAHAALRDAGLLTEELAVMRGKVIVLAATSYAGHKEGDK